VVKRIICIGAGLLIVLSLLTGCGTQKSASANNTSARQEVAADKANLSMTDSANGTAGKPGAAGSQSQQSKAAETKTINSMAIAGTEVPAQTLQNAILSQRKVIRNANISIVVDDFDKAYGQLGTAISAFGFIQESNIKKEKIYVDSKETYITKGVIVIRIAADRFEGVLKDVKGLGLLTDENIKSDDITDKFFDTEARLRVLKIEQDRLEEYLKKLSDLDAIFKTQSRLTQIRQEIENLTGTLRKWGDLVDLSTITINMSEKRPDSVQVPPKEKAYWQRLLGGFKGSFKGVINFCGELVIFLAEAIPVVLLLGLLGWAALAVYGRIRKNSIKSINSSEKEENKGA